MTLHLARRPALSHMSGSPSIATTPGSASGPATRGSPDDAAPPFVTRRLRVFALPAGVSPLSCRPRLRGVGALALGGSPLLNRHSPLSDVTASFTQGNAALYPQGDLHFNSTTHPFCSVADSTAHWRLFMRSLIKRTIFLKSFSDADFGETWRVIDHPLSPLSLLTPPQARSPIESAR